MKKSHCQISSVHTQGLLKKCPTEFARIATKKFLYARHVLALKFTWFMYRQKKTIYLSGVLLENPRWNLSCITKRHQFSSKEQREAKSLQNRNKHTTWFRAPWHHSVFLLLDNSSFPIPFTNKCCTFSTAKGTCTLLSWWTVFHNCISHPRAPWFLASCRLQSAMTSRVTDIVEKNLEGITRSSLVSQLKACSTLAMQFLRYLLPVFKVSNFLALQFKAITFCHLLNEPE